MADAAVGHDEDMNSASTGFTPDHDLIAAAHARARLHLSDAIAILRGLDAETQWNARGLRALHEKIASLRASVEWQLAHLGGEVRFSRGR